MKQKLKKILKVTLIGLSSIAGLVLIYLGLAFVLSRISVNSEAKDKEEISIYILTNGVHTDLVLPVKNDVIDWSKIVKFDHTTGKDSTAELLAFGWGDKGFYLETPTWSDLKFSVAFKAAFGLSNAAIHATYYKLPRRIETWKEIKISKENYRKLTEFILADFTKTEQGEIIPIQTNANYGKSDAFYEARGSYSLFHTCNTWANNGLKACNQKACLWTPFDKGIFYQYRNK